MADSGTRDRVARLAAIRAETAAKLGYSGSDAVSGADREKIELSFWHRIRSQRTE